MKVVINNLSNNLERYVVARVVSGNLWYWGSWNKKEDAEEVALTFDNAIVIDMEED